MSEIIMSSPFVMEERSRKLTGEELKAIIAAQQIPSKAKGLFSGANIEKFKGLLNSDVLLELEALHQEGDLEDQGLQEYYTQLSEYQELVREMDRCIQSFMDFIKIGLPARIRSAFPEGGGVFTRNLGELMVELGNLTDSFYVHESETFFRNVFIGTFHSRMMVRIVLEVFMEYFSWDFPKARRKFLPPRYTDEKINLFLQAANEHFVRNYSVENPALQFIRQLPLMQEAINKRHFRPFTDIIESSGSNDRIQLARDARAKFDLIRDLESMVGLDRADKRIGSGRITVCGMRERLDPYGRAFTLYQFRISLNPNLPGDYEITQMRLPNGRVTTRYGVTSDYFEGLIDRATGEINLTAGLPYSLSINVVPYLQLKNAIYDVILERLAEREKELLDEQERQAEARKSLLPGPTETTTTREVREDVLEVYPEVSLGMEEEADDAELVGMPDGSLVPGFPVLDSIPEGDFLSGDEYDLKYKRALRGLSGNRVIHNLRLLLTPAGSGNGSSHIKFNCRGGGTYVIAVHGDKEVGIGLLLTCLNQFGITPKEFAQRVHGRKRF